MAGYIGSRIAGIQVDGYTQSEADAEFVNDPNAVITVSGSNVGINTTPSIDWRTTFNTTALQVGQSGCLFNLDVSNADRRCMVTSNALLNSSGDFQHILEGPLTVYSQQGGTHRWYTAASDLSGATASAFERMRIDSSGNLLVGKTVNDNTTTGVKLDRQGYISASIPNDYPLILNRQTSDGDIAVFRKDGSTVGSIGTTTGDIWIGTGDTGLRFHDASDMVYPINPATGTGRDNAIDLGEAVNRFDDIYATNGTIQTSDRNEKQDIEALSDAEQRVAVAAKGLLRKYRWKDKVAEKGDAARIHFGIIAQDLQAAFEAEGLDAGRYGMFISSTWWEAEVEKTREVEQEDGTTITETYTETETYDEPTEGATERTRLGVRYPELLAFIIAAL